MKMTVCIVALLLLQLSTLEGNLWNRRCQKKGENFLKRDEQYNNNNNVCMGVG